MKAKTAKKVLVSVVMGSDSDLPVMSEAAKILDEFNIGYELVITSAHRTPQRTKKFSHEAASRGVKVIIAGAGAAAHLAGVIASHTKLPVIGVPINSTASNGLDALLSTVQMPGGVPVAGMAIGKSGAKNAALLAVRMLALSNKNLAIKLNSYVVKMAKDVHKKQEKLSCLKS